MTSSSSSSIVLSAIGHMTTTIVPLEARGRAIPCLEWPIMAIFEDPFRYLPTAEGRGPTAEQLSRLGNENWLVAPLQCDMSRALRTCPAHPGARSVAFANLLSPTARTREVRSFSAAPDALSRPHARMPSCRGWKYSPSHSSSGLAYLLRISIPWLPPVPVRSPLPPPHV